MFGGEKLAHAEIGAAHHPHLAVAPGLGGDELNHFGQIELLLRAPMVPGAARIVRAAHVGDDLDIAARDPEFREARLVLAQGGEGLLKLAGVGRPREERGELLSRREGAEDIVGQLDAVAHFEAPGALRMDRIADLGLFGCARRVVVGVLGPGRGIGRPDAFGVHMLRGKRHGGTPLMMPVK